MLRNLQSKIKSVTFAAEPRPCKFGSNFRGVGQRLWNRGVSEKVKERDVPWELRRISMFTSGIV